MRRHSRPDVGKTPQERRLVQRSGIGDHFGAGIPTSPTNPFSGVLMFETKNEPGNPSAAPAPDAPRPRGIVAEHFPPSSPIPAADRPRYSNADGCTSVDAPAYGSPRR